MGHNVFVYGTLMSPAVYCGVTGTLPQMLDANLPEFRRYAIDDTENTAYPAMIPEPEGVVEGRLVTNVAPDELAALDRFEEISEGLYSRRSVTVETSAGPIDAETYVASDTLRRKLKGDWDPAEFERTRLGDYLRLVVAEFQAAERARLENK